ncbi:MAG TPA: thermonuclease family protein [Leptolyngbyaceae cyanobacterium M33_DOE_097]|uniref:Thermonuclease family protein n=1 Tax=Oscillatoriales cyanobacterium SpSt-418 TaxID=2282169 RepID=A0A7C3PHT1_9CYAN|nr:thermonuclease family protein [Leptolyngbyaceae cyanobacterium M33_DOE_097]
MKSSSVTPQPCLLQRQWIWIIGLLPLLCLLGCQATILPSGLTVKVVDVWNGRDVEVTDVEYPSSITERVRLEGIAAPGLSQDPWGSAAQVRLVELLGDQPVLLEMDAELRDRTGRRLAYLWQQGRLLNEQLVAEGLVLFVPHPPNNKYDQRLAQAQDYARALGLGIWNEKNPLREIKTAE